MRAFNANSLVDSYALVDDCPDDLLDAVVALPFDTPISERLEGLAAWKSALRDGRLPPEGVWPGSPFDEGARQALNQLDLPRFLRNQQDLVDEVLLAVVESFAAGKHHLDELVEQEIRELEELLKARRASGEAASTKQQQMVELSNADRARAVRTAQEAFADRVGGPDEAIVEEWEELVRLWTTVEGVFGDLGQLLGRGWDLTQGVLRRTGWLDAVRLAELVERLPQLAEVIRTLGRMQDDPDNESITERLMGSMLRIEEERREVPTPLIPAETRGIERGGDVARMLPGEAALLGHARLRMLWHARRAERALMTYRVEGVDVEYDIVEREVEGLRDEERPRQVRGPIIVVVDTSGSMHGVPEEVAKALVLEAVRTAHSERRACFLYSFSGPGEVREIELDLSLEGIGRMLEFLAWSFHGGTDVTAPMTRVLERLRDEKWARADVLLLTDGEWPAPGSIVERAVDQRERGTRFHGVLIGNRRAPALEAICDHVHVFSDWSAVR